MCIILMLSLITYQNFQKKNAPFALRSSILYINFFFVISIKNCVVWLFIVFRQISLCIFINFQLNNTPNCVVVEIII